MSVIRRVVLVIVPVLLSWGTVSVWPTMNGAVLATVSVVTLDWSPVTVVSRGGQVAASRTTQDFGRFSTPLFWPQRYLLNQRLTIASGGAPPWPPWWK